MVNFYKNFFCKINDFLDYKKGFGGQFGVQTDRQDKSALGWTERENLQQHESQTGNSIFLFEIIFLKFFRL